MNRYLPIIILIALSVTYSASATALSDKNPKGSKTASSNSKTTKKKKKKVVKKKLKSRKMKDTGKAEPKYDSFKKSVDMHHKGTKAGSVMHADKKEGQTFKTTKATGYVSKQQAIKGK